VKADLEMQREKLVRRSHLARLQLRRETRMVGESLHWTRTAATIASTPLARQALFGVALSLLGAARASRLLALAGRAVLALQVGRALFGARRTVHPPRIQ
jgi:hypothetical protein